MVGAQSIRWDEPTAGWQQECTRTVWKGVIGPATFTIYDQLSDRILINMCGPKYDDPTMLDCYDIARVDTVEEAMAFCEWVARANSFDTQ